MLCYRTERLKSDSLCVYCLFRFILFSETTSSLCVTFFFKDKKLIFFFNKVFSFAHFSRYTIYVEKIWTRMFGERVGDVHERMKFFSTQCGIIVIAEWEILENLSRRRVVIVQKKINKNKYTCLRCPRFWLNQFKNVFDSVNKKKLYTHRVKWGKAKS